VLHFNETYWGNLAPGGVGSRKFNVDMEGRPWLADFDIVARAGGPMRAVQVDFQVNVTDGTLNIDFSKGSADLPLVSAIEVSPAFNTFRIDVGSGTVYEAPDERYFTADLNHVSGGLITREVAGEVANTDDDRLYWTGRYGTNFGYNIPVNTGFASPSLDTAYYRVVLHFNETYWGNLVPGGVGSRKFNVDIEGQRKLTGYDIFAKAGGAMRSVREAFTVAVTDKVLNIRLTRGSANYALLSALEVFPVPSMGAGGARVATGDAELEEAVFRLSPNPATTQVWVTTSVPAAVISGTQVVDLTGRVFLLNSHRIVEEHKLEINVAELREGLYLLRLHTPGGPRTLRFIKQ
jgi:hypothetical protein